MNFTRNLRWKPIKIFPKVSQIQMKGEEETVPPDSQWVKSWPSSYATISVRLPTSNTTIVTSFSCITSRHSPLLFPTTASWNLCQEHSYLWCFSCDWRHSDIVTAFLLLTVRRYPSAIICGNISTGYSKGLSQREKAAWDSVMESNCTCYVTAGEKS